MTWIGWWPVFRRRFLPRESEPVELTLFTRPGCHLCDEMKSEIARASLGNGYRLVEIDVDSDSRLAEQYGRSIPVLAVGGRPLFKGRLTAPELLRKLSRKFPDPRAS